MIKDADYYFALSKKINTFANYRWQTDSSLFINLWSSTQPYYLIMQPYKIPKYKQQMSAAITSYYKLDNFVMEILLYHFPMLKEETIVIEHSELIGRVVLETLTLHSSMGRTIKKTNTYIYQPKIQNP